MQYAMEALSDHFEYMSQHVILQLNTSQVPVYFLCKQCAVVYPCASYDPCEYSHQHCTLQQDN